ncbi:MAG: DNA topoisomerase IB [Bacteroidota bacterium]
MTTTKLSHAKLLQANNDFRRSAKVAHLIYITGNTSGFTRMKKGKGFIYLVGNKILKDKKQLERIHKLAIPPSWKNVWISRSPNGHIQATGLDLRNRKQYRYHAQWSSLRTETKFHHLYEFGKLLPKLRKKIKTDIRSKKLTQQKVLAAAIELMQKTYIRVGNESYEKENGSYGLTTLKDRHISFESSSLTVSFSGKKGVEQHIKLTDKKLARIIKECRDIPGKTLFQYYDEKNKKRAIDSAMLNNYIREGTAGGFSAKDIRTWAGSVQAINYCLSEENFPRSKKKKRTAAGMLDWVSQQLGNTRNVCKKYYVHPSLISLYEEKKELPRLISATEKKNR